MLTGRCTEMKKPKTLNQLVRKACDFLQVVNRHKPDAKCIALAKRKLDRELRDQGFSCKQAKAETSRRFKRD